MTPIPDRETDYGGYRPGNFGGVYYGDTTPREAIAKSMNAAAVAVMNYTGAERSAACARAFGLPLSAEDENLALALWRDFGRSGSESGRGGLFRARERGRVYLAALRALRAKGREKDIFVGARLRPARLAKTTAYLLTDCLRHAVMGGTARTLSSLPFEVAAKTGTVQKTEELNTDAWCAGLHHRPLLCCLARQQRHDRTRRRTRRHARRAAA